MSGSAPEKGTTQLARAARVVADDWPRRGACPEVVQWSSLTTVDSTRSDPLIDGEGLLMVGLGVLSTYPPTQCGLATFTAPLGAALPDGVAGGVVRVVDAVGGSRPEGVVGQLIPDSAASCRAAAGCSTARRRDHPAQVRHLRWHGR